MEIVAYTRNTIILANPQNSQEIILTIKQLFLIVFLKKKNIELKKKFGDLAFYGIMAMVHRNYRTWKSSGGRLDGKPEVGEYGTVHALYGDQYRSVQSF